MCVGTPESVSTGSSPACVPRARVCLLPLFDAAAMAQPDRKRKRPKPKKKKKKAAADQPQQPQPSQHV